MSEQWNRPVDLSAKHRALAKALGLSQAQKELMSLHGTPAEFAKAVYDCVPSDISMGEARCAIDKYNKEWEEAK